MIEIFCPKCQSLVLDRPVCSVCGWKRPARGPGNIRWQVELPFRIYRSPCYIALAGPVLAVPTEEGRLIALERGTGRVAWEYALPPGWGTYGPVAEGTLLWIAPEDMRPLPQPGKALLALEAATGQERWRLELPAHSLSRPALAGGRLYFSDAGGQLHAVEAASGRPLWTVPHPNWGPAAPVVGAGWLAIGGQGTLLAAYDPESGATLWQFQAPGLVASPLAATEELLFVRCWDGVLYALDGAGGEVRWKLPPERGQGPTTPPIAGAGMVFIGTRVRPAGEGERRYALLCLDAATGREIWRFPTSDPLSTSPGLARGLVLAGTRKGELIAVDIASGQAVWNAALGRHLVAEPVVDEQAAYLAGRDGSVWAIRRQGETLLPAEEYLRRGEWAAAAAAYALRGEDLQAATLYDQKLQQRLAAAQFYERAGKIAEAARQYELDEKIEPARTLYQQAGDVAGVARMTERLGDLLGAAALYEQAGEMAEAARLYEAGGDLPRAAEMYESLQKYEQAQRLWQSLEDVDRAAQACIAAGRPLEAARLLEEHNRLEWAARLYRQNGEPAHAADLLERLERWEQVAEIAAEMRDFRREGQARLRLGQFESAAAAFFQAARQLARLRQPPDEEVAALFEQAADLFINEPLYDEERAARCRKEMHRYRCLPEILVEGASEEALRENAWGRLQLRVHNEGFGVACAIRIELEGPFDVAGEQEILSLKPRQSRALGIRIRPHQGHVGLEVPLKVALTYQDMRGQEYDVRHELGVHVEKDALFVPAGSPVQFNIGGDFIQSGARKESGDRVEIHRGAQATTRLATGADAVEIQRPGPPVRRCSNCNLPIYERGFTYCPECGMPLVPKYEQPE